MITYDKLVVLVTNKTYKSIKISKILTKILIPLRIFHLVFPIFLNFPHTNPYPPLITFRNITP